MKNLPPATNRWWLFAIGIFLLCGFTFAERQAEPSIFDSLQFDDVIKVDIETDLDSLLSTKTTKDEVPATFAYKDQNGKKQNWNVTLQVRGKFRRRVCPFPPLYVNFPKKDLKAQGFSSHNDLKLVTHCMDNDQGDESVLREYLTYKLYQIVSPVHYRVQLLKIKYRDSNGANGFTHYGILLEDEDEMKARYNSKLCEDCFSVAVDSLEIGVINTHDLFQYMIGNPDWNLNMLRNMKLLQPKDGGKDMIVPYDFDFSGLVNAPYATPDNTLGITTVRQRVFLGIAKSPDELAPTIELFRQKKGDLLNCIKKFKYLDATSRKDMMNYIESFYRCLDAGLDLQTPGKC